MCPVVGTRSGLPLPPGKGAPCVDHRLPEPPPTPVPRVWLRILSVSLLSTGSQEHPGVCIVAPPGWGCGECRCWFGQVPLQEAGAGSFCWGAGSEGEKSQFGVIPCQSRARDTKGHLLGKLNPNCKFRDLCLPCAASQEARRSMLSQQGPGQGPGCGSMAVPVRLHAARGSQT